MQIDFFINERAAVLENGAATDQENARYMLQIWTEDDDDPSVENMTNILENLGMFEALKVLKSK